MNKAMFQRLSHSFDGKSKIRTTSGREVTVLNPNVTKARGINNDYEGTTIQYGINQFRLGEKTSRQRYQLTDMQGNPQQLYIHQQVLDGYIATRG